MANPRGVKDLVIVGGASNKLFVIDGDTGKILLAEDALRLKARPSAAIAGCAPTA